MIDLISRQAAIDALDKVAEMFPYRIPGKAKTYRQYNEAWSDAIDAAENALEALPSAQRWIPCSERLPEDGAMVWVTIKGHDVIRCEDGEPLEQAIERINKIRWVTQGYWSEEEHGWNDPSYGCPLIVQPIAWMPIDTPKPYREDGDADAAD